MAKTARNPTRRLARAPRSEGPRTTLRVPDALAAAAARLAEELGISRNDALVRLATRGARLHEQEQRIAARREERWAAVLALETNDAAGGFPSPAEARDVVSAARERLPEAAR